MFCFLVTLLLRLRISTVILWTILVLLLLIVVLFFSKTVTLKTISLSFSIKYQNKSKKSA